MKKSTIIYEEKTVLTAKFYHPKSDDYLNYDSTIIIKDAVKTPIEMILKFRGIYPYAAPMPPEDHTIKATSILDLCVKMKRWFKKYGYIIQ